MTYFNFITCNNTNFTRVGFPLLNVRVFEYFAVEKISMEPVYTKHPSRLEERQLQEIADTIPTDKRIHLGLRLGLSAVRIEEIEHDERRVNAVKYQILVDWQKNVGTDVDQCLTLAKIMESVGIAGVAKMISEYALSRVIYLFMDCGTSLDFTKLHTQRVIHNLEIASF